MADKTDASGGEAGDRGSLSISHSDIGIPIHFQDGQASSPYEALNSVCHSRVHRDMRPPVQMRRKPMAFSSVSTGDSDMPSSCEMKDEPEFKALKGYHDFF